MKATVRTIKVGGRRAPCTEFGYSLGTSVRPAGVALWSRGDRSTRVIGPPGSGKTTRLLAPALRDAPGAVLATSTKADLYELTVGARRREGRPVVLCDLGGLIGGPSRPAGMPMAGVPMLCWSPVTGAADSRVAEKRARAFCAATRTSGSVSSASEGAAWYKDRAGTLLACLLHAAALDGADLDQLLAWVRDPTDKAITRILGTDPDAAPGWAQVHAECVTGDPRAVSLTLATMNQALACYAHAEVRATAAGTPTDLAELIRAGGTVYVLGKDDPYSSVAPLVTAICENVLDTAEDLAADPAVSPHRRLDPPFLACLDEAPTICPLPSLAQRVNDGRGRGIAILYAAQSWSSVKARWGHDPAAALGDATSNLVVYGGCKDPDFLADLERLCGQHKVTRRSRTRTGDGLLAGGPVQTSTAQHWEPVLRAHQIGQLPIGQALLLAENCPPIITRQRALFEDPRLWPQIAAEVESVRAAGRTARGQEPAGQGRHTDRGGRR